MYHYNRINYILIQVKWIIEQFNFTASAFRLGKHFSGAETVTYCTKSYFNTHHVVNEILAFFSAEYHNCIVVGLYSTLFTTKLSALQYHCIITGVN